MDRKSADPQLRANASARLADMPELAAADPGDAMWHELQVHQIELEMQNELLSQTQAQLVESLAELRIAAVAFESQQGMLVTDALGVMIRVNQAFSRLTGYSAAEAVGRTPALLSSGRHAPEFYAGLWLTLNDCGYWQGEIWNRRKDGRIYAEWLTISAVSDTDGAVSHYIGTFSEITQNKEAEAKIHRLAYYDSLTRLPNRTLFHDRLSQAITSNTRTGHCGALMFLDLDHFKILNDTRGHDVGDQLLVEVARRILAAVRAGDTVARLGGDEFVVMLENLSDEPDAAATQTRLVGEKIRDSLARPYALAGGDFHSSASIGATVFHNDNAPVAKLLKEADLAMYRAKNAGRNAMRFFNRAMQTALDERSALETDLRRALERGELRLYYQAQVDGRQAIRGAEALLRWMHPERGMIPPDGFIALAEESGLILPIGHWVLATACAQLSLWAASATTRELRLAVNVSARQFFQPDFVAEVLAVLAATGANPARLKIELTESMMLEDIDDATEKMQALKVRGIGFSLDDFGTGHSSLAYLTRLPLDQLKIDRSFVRNLPHNRNDAVIAQTIISMARSLDLDVIAEGVETEAQQAFLASAGCHSCQGYLFGRPLPVAQFEQLAGSPEPSPAAPGR